MKSFLFALLLLATVTPGWAAGPLPEAVQATDFDLPNCQVMRGTEVEPLEEEDVKSLLGFGEAPKGDAQRKPRANRPAKEENAQYLLAFKRPVAIGTVLGAHGELRIHKPGAPWPANPANPSDWLTVEVPSSQSEPRFAPLPPATTTRAILASIPPRKDGAYLRLVTPRLLNYTPDATANADMEYTTEPTLSAPYTYDAGHVTRGRRAWLNTGKTGKGIYPRGPISDVAPSWFVLSWPEKRHIEGVLLQDDFDKYELQSFAGPAGLNAAAATEEEWQTIKKVQETMVGTQRWLKFTPLDTSALRVRITKVTGNEPAVAKIEGFHVFADLGDKPVPPPVRRVAEEPPVKITYNIPQDGQVTFVVDGPDGTRVRNVVANVERPAGANAVTWDLKDDNGSYVKPGKYHWKGITHPPLELKYEMTAYPNVTSYFPERPAWLTGPDGAGGWLADHTPPHAACTAGDRVFLGAPVAESGVSLIECDLEGRKLWGHHSFAGFTGCQMLASDGKTVFNTMSATNFAKAGLDKKTDAVWAVDLETRKVRTVAMLEPTAERMRGIQGFAARDNKVYMAIHSTGGWLSSPAGAADVDAQNSLPTYAVARNERFAHELVPDPRTDFVRLFRLKDLPAGQHLIWLESTKTLDRQQHLMLAFHKPVAIGSLVFPPPPKEEKVQFQISYLKPHAPYPPRVQEKGDWEIVPLTDQSAWAVQPMPAGIATRALRMTFTKGGAGAADDLLADVEDKKGAPSLDKADSISGKKSGFAASDEDMWMRKIEGMKLLNRRYENLYASATVRVSSGKLAADGTWDAQRTEPISEVDPAIYALEWKDAQKVRGLAIKEIDGQFTEIDVYKGPAGQPIDIAAADGWENVTRYQQQLRDYYGPDPKQNSEARYMDGYVDFGQEMSTRAIRLRVVKQWDTKEHRPTGVRKDQGGQDLDPKRCHVYGIAPLKYLGGESPIDAKVAERVEVLDAATGKIVQEVALPNSGVSSGFKKGNILAFNPAGDLFAIAERKLVRVDMKAGKHEPLVSDLLEPTALACNAKNFFIFDAAKERQNIRVYDAGGKFLRVIGEPGGVKRGPWNQNRMQDVTALTTDPKGQVWAVESNYWPKRVTLWNPDGTFQKEFLGPTQYGGAGCLDPGDKRRLFYGPLEFELDWATGKTRLKNLTSLDGRETSDSPRRVNNRLYLVNTHPENNPNYGLIYLHEGDHARVIAAIGVAAKCTPLLNPKLLQFFGGKNLMDWQCLWSDLNGDEEAQPEEIQLWKNARERPYALSFDNHLTAMASNVMFKVKRWLPNGAPIYERTELPVGEGMNIALENGNIYRFEPANKYGPAGAQRPDGTTVWTYPTEGSGGHALLHATLMHPGQIVSEIGLAGHATAHAGDLGEFLVFNSNIGIFNIMTADGLFAGQLFREVRDPAAKPWSGQKNDRGLLLNDITPGQEHFNGYFCRTSDNRYYAVVGHNHASVVEVVGLEKFKRFAGDIEIAGEQIRATEEWERERQTRQVFTRAPVVDCYKMQKPPTLDGQLNDWPGVSAEMDENAKFYIGYDDTNLYLAYQAVRHGPFKNQGSEWDKLFKTGASVDLQIGTDPAAPADRRGPVPGDKRLLMTMMGTEPTAVLYEAVVPGTPKAKAWQVVSPVAALSFDRVVKLEKPRLVSAGNEARYVVEAAIPLSALNLKITPGLRLKMDWGILASGPDGTEVLRREYWANKATQIIADAPSEAALHPILWGHVRFHEETMNAHLDPTAVKKDKSLNDLLNDLK